MRGDTRPRARTRRTVVTCALCGHCRLHGRGCATCALLDAWRRRQDAPMRGWR